MELAIYGGKPTFTKKIPIQSQIGREELNAAVGVLKKGILSSSRKGFFVQQFENEFARFLGVKYAVSTSSGTSALHTAVCALNIKAGDEILVPALTFVSSASVILQERAKPVFVDVDPETFNLDTADLEKKITTKTKAIIAVHLYGCPANIKEIIRIAEKHKLKVIEDCAQAHGAKFFGKYVGLFGDIACFSFQQSKNMVCGEGGMVISNNKNLYKNCSAIIDHGLVDGNLQNYDYDRLGYNYHITDLQSAIGTQQLKKLKKMNERRRRNANLYKKYLSDTELFFQKELKDSQGVFYCLTALLPERLKSKRDWFVDAVGAENAEVNKLYPLALTQTKLFFRNRQKDNCQVAENIAGRLFNFCTSPMVDEKYIRKTSEAVKKVLNYLDKN